MTAVLLFARAPHAGTVKTRLAREVGSDRALSVYRAIGRQVSDAVADRYPLTVWYTPPGAEATMRDWLGAHRYRPQDEGDLGARLARAFEAHFAEAAGPVIAIGADAPSVDADVIAEAEAALRAYDVVLGPALDGGYYLIGLRAPAPALFAEMPWGGPDVTRVTVARARAAGLSVMTLAPRRDIDTAADLAAARITVP